MTIYQLLPLTVIRPNPAAVSQMICKLLKLIHNEKGTRYLRPGAFLYVQEALIQA